MSSLRRRQSRPSYSKRRADEKITVNLTAPKPGSHRAVAPECAQTMLHAIVGVRRKTPKSIAFWPAVASKLIFSDMQEDLPPGTRRHLDPEELANTHVVAMNVKRLQHDTIDPAVFRKRLDTWGDRVTAAGAAEWRTGMDATKLTDYLSTIR